MKVTDQLTSNKNASLTCVNGPNVVTVKERQEEPQKDGGPRSLFWLWTQGTQVASPEQGKKQILDPYLPDRNALYQPSDFRAGSLSWISDTRGYPQGWCDWWCFQSLSLWRFVTSVMKANAPSLGHGECVLWPLTIRTHFPICLMSVLGIDLTKCVRVINSKSVCPEFTASWCHQSVTVL